MGVGATGGKGQDRPAVSVVIPHFNDMHHLDICLSALQAQSYPQDRFEVIVADNGSPQGPEAVEAVIAGRARLVVVPEKGAGPARNGGVAVARGDLLAFTDSDCVPVVDWLREGLAALERWDFVGGRVRVLVEDAARPKPTEAFEMVFAFDNEKYVHRLRFTGAGNLFCSRKLFETVGGFRTGLSEDVEWSRRALAAGFTLGYEAKAAVGHPARTTWAELVRKWRRINLETFGLQPEGPTRRLKWALRNLLLPASAVVHTPRVIFSPDLHDWRSRSGALWILYRLRMWRLFDSLRFLKSADGT
jgi:glycosyltransferase involved in cell wall biosynthesis